ncbi:flagellar protein export ATPase FliI [Desulfurella multipotens]|uniref:flagellar protein export ATPase FliI n=1 Tax=Desulfurella multipotens TaxID=79269 RepID=UPI000CAE432B|nr:flagellar protein export ATPase FliI [Desulfurella multipotens]PMP64587.1 MAG: flagellar protein export ATPase FliI [Desulfurella multipotens]
MNHNKIKQLLDKNNFIVNCGKIKEVVGLTIISSGPSDIKIGDVCFIESDNGYIEAEVVGFKDKNVLLMPLGNMDGIKLESIVRSTSKGLKVGVGNNMLGRILNALGKPIDSKGPILIEKHMPLYPKPTDPMQRQIINEPIITKIKAIDALLTLGKGQRIGIFAGSGVGKSTLLGMIARKAKADVNVIALIGERGREVREFIENDLTQEGLKKSVVVVATSDEAPLLRREGAFLASAIAKFFSDQGLDVMMMMDSVTRFAMAQREIGLAIGEPPTMKGYTPSVFSLLPRLMEIPGKFQKGSITAIYTVLVDGDDFNEPIADTARSILDGHIVLSRKIAEKNHYPAIDILKSVSRLMNSIVNSEHKFLANNLRKHMSIYEQAEDLINIGAYSVGSNPDIDASLRVINKINEFLVQGIDESYEFSETIDLLSKALE